MKKFIAILIVFLLVVNAQGAAQWSVTPSLSPMPTGNRFPCSIHALESSEFMFELRPEGVNNIEIREVVLELRLKINGIQILRYTSDPVVIEPGVLRLRLDDGLNEIIRDEAGFGTIDEVNQELLTEIALTGKLPGGPISFCFEVRDEHRNLVGGNGCNMQFQVMQLNAPTASTPSAESFINAQNPIWFRWNTQLVFNQRSESVLNIYEVMEGQTPIQAIESNLPLQSHVLETERQWRWDPIYSPVEAGDSMHLVWQVETIYEGFEQERFLSQPVDFWAYKAAPLAPVLAAIFPVHEKNGSGPSGNEPRRDTIFDHNTEDPPIPDDTSSAVPASPVPPQVLSSLQNAVTAINPNLPLQVLGLVIIANPIANPITPQVPADTLSDAFVEDTIPQQSDPIVIADTVEGDTDPENPQPATTKSDDLLSPAVSDTIAKSTASNATDTPKVPPVINTPEDDEMSSPCMKSPVDLGEDLQIAKDQGKSVRLGGAADPRFDYEWVSDPPGEPKYSAQIEVTPTQTTRYVLTKTDANGECTVSDEVWVVVVEPFTAHVDSDACGNLIVVAEPAAPTPTSARSNATGVAATGAPLEKTLSAPRDTTLNIGPFTADLKGVYLGVVQFPGSIPPAKSPAPIPSSKFSYDWGKDGQGNTLSPREAGPYSVTVTDGHRTDTLAVEYRPTKRFHDGFSVLGVPRIVEAGHPERGFVIKDLSPAVGMPAYNARSFQLTIWRDQGARTVIPGETEKGFENGAIHWDGILDGHQRLAAPGTYYWSLILTNCDNPDMDAERVYQIRDIGRQGGAAEYSPLYEASFGQFEIVAPSR